jgi:hypothetical protein
MYPKMPLCFDFVVHMQWAVISEKNNFLFIFGKFGIWKLPVADHPLVPA